MAGSPIFYTTTVPVSLTTSGAPADGPSWSSDVSADGRYVLVGSLAGNFAPDDTNGLFDLYRKDLLTWAMEPVSLKGALGGDVGAPAQAAISGDGRFVVFASDAANLVALDLNGSTDIFLRDMQTDSVTLVSSSSSNARGERDSYAPDVSTDGRYVVFTSLSANLVAGDTNAVADVFRKDLLTGLVERVSTGATGSQADAASDNAAISADGRYVVFQSGAGNLVAGDDNVSLDVFRKDMLSGAITRVSTGPDGARGSGDARDASVSADGRYVAFVSEVDGLLANDANSAADVLVKDLATGALILASSSTDGVQANQRSYSPAISDNGRYVAFASDADNLTWGDVNGVSDVFRKSLVGGDLIGVSVNDYGGFGDLASSLPAINADGSKITFASDAGNLAWTHAPGVVDVFEQDVLEIPTFSIEALSPSLPEGDSGVTRFTFSVSRTGLAESTASVSYAVLAQDVDAADFAGGVLLGGSLVFYAGESEKTIAIDVAGDLVAEPTETFTVKLSNPSRGTQLAYSSARATIRDDDGGSKLAGTPGADTLVGTAGSDRIDGGAGVDTATMLFARSSASVTKSGNDWTIESGGQVDTLTGVEYLQFSDATYPLVKPPLGRAPEDGQDEGFLFDPVYYLLANPGKVPAITVDTALEDWFSVGAAKFLPPNAWFDAWYYTNKWPDLTPLYLDDATLFRHYNLFGVWEGRSAGPAFEHFDGGRYLTENPDVAAYVDAHLAGFLGSRTNGAIAHFIIFGSNEQRLAYDTDGAMIDMGYSL